MATTTNYGWVTPDDTDLVKDGAAAIRTLGSSADTTTKNLNPETTLGDLSFRSATSNVNTRIPIGSSGQHLTVVAGVPAWSTASDQTPLTTKGDLFTFSTVDARLPVGTNGQVLTADSNEATGLKFATPAGGALVFVGGTTFTTSATVNVNDVFSATYANYIIISDMVASAPISNNLRFRVSGADDTASNYFGQTLFVNNTTVGASQTLSQSSARIIDATAGSNSFYANVTSPFATAKTQLYAYGIYSGSTSAMELQNKQITFNATTSFTGFTIFTSSGTITGTIRVYGLANS